MMVIQGCVRFAYLWAPAMFALGETPCSWRSGSRPRSTLSAGIGVPVRNRRICVENADGTNFFP